MYACLDLGSNSFHLLIAQSIVPGRIEIVERFSEKVQLGEGVVKHRRISQTAFQRGLDCLRRFREVIDRYPVQSCWALGTNALRVAENAEEFIRAAAAYGFQLAVITGEQEAALVYAGVVSALPHDSEGRLVIDIGGGSTELIVGSGRSAKFSRSLPVGCVSWRDQWFDEFFPTRRDYLGQLIRACDAASAVFGTIVPEVRKFGWDSVYASSGTAKMLSSVCQANDLGDGEITLESLYALQPLIVDSTLNGELLQGLAENRRDLVLPGWAILTALMETLQLQRIGFSPTALREGMLAHMLLARVDSQQAADAGYPPVTDINPRV
jgi:exopolyphosphatase / guanosine-5'-triphosphate,3'-diphosphate pyrophosphatase